LILSAVRGDFAESFDAGFEVFDDLLGEVRDRAIFLGLKPFNDLNGLNVLNGLEPEASSPSDASDSSKLSSPELENAEAGFVTFEQPACPVLDSQYK
jgi:hypothetical protein